MKLIRVSLLGLFFFTLLFFSCCSPKSQKKMNSLRVSANNRYLEYSNGEPFLYLGCTAWELFHRLNREEAVEYLTDRSVKGFSVIQAVVLAELDGLNTPNPYGDIPLYNSDPAQPNEKYFEHVDFIVNKAEELGLFIGMLPTWGDKVVSGNIFDVQNAELYGEFLGQRYKDNSIIWILGGDRAVTNDTVYNIWNAMATGLRKGDGGNHLITFHPPGGRHSSFWVHNEDWLDFNMYQTGHGQKYKNVYEFAKRDYMLHPVKPFIDGEPPYEDIPVKFSMFRALDNVLDSDNLIRDRSYFERGFFTGHDVRVHAYWNFLSGACGYTYGNNAIWQMFKKGGKVAIACLYDWQESLNRPGSNSIKYVRQLFESRPFWKLVPDQSAIFGANRKDSAHVRSAVASDGSFLIAYLSVGQPVNIVMKKVTGDKISAWWYNPRDGEVTEIGEFDNQGHRKFTPPTSGVDNDWVLVLDNSAINHGKPY